MNIAPTLIALQTLYMVHKHNEEDLEKAKEQAKEHEND